MKKYIKYFDYFGVNVHFLYQSEYKYHSVTGGLLFIFFILLTITYIACNLKPFLTRKNMTLIFYDKKIETTDEIDFENYTSRFALRTFQNEPFNSFYTMFLSGRFSGLVRNWSFPEMKGTNSNFRGSPQSLISSKIVSNRRFFL